MSTFPSDGNLPHGSFDITILEISGEIFTADNFQWSEEPNADLTRMRKDGTPKSSKVLKGFITGSADIQLPDADVAEPQVNDTFTIGSDGYYITGRGRTYTSNDEYKMSVNIRRCVNPLITNPVASQTFTQSNSINTITASAVGPESGLSYTWSAENLPSGLSIDSSTGEISGTPDTVESVTATIKATATDSDGNTVVGLRKIPMEVTA